MADGEALLRTLHYIPNPVCLYSGVKYITTSPWVYSSSLLTKKLVMSVIDLLSLCCTLQQCHVVVVGWQKKNVVVRFVVHACVLCKSPRACMHAFMHASYVHAGSG